MTDYVPGCFGSVLIYNAEDDYCRKCVLSTSCADKAEQNRKRLEEEVGIDTPSFFRVVRRRAEVHRENVDSVLTGDTTRTPAAPKPAPTPKPTPEPMPTAPTNKLTPYEASLLPDLPVKVRAELARWVSRGVDPSALDKNASPFDGLDGFKIAAQITQGYLTLGLVTKRELKQFLVDLAHAAGDKPWSDSSLQSNINIVTGAFKACGYPIIKESV